MILHENFSEEHIRELQKTSRRDLRKLVASGELKREGSGKNICYYRLK